MKREARILSEKAIDSLLLSIEAFNRPWDRGREESVLILIDRAFELLLKACIVHKGGKIREPRAKETFGFDKRVRICLGNESIKCLSENDAITIQIINSLRDAAQHYIIDLSEQQLYMYTQGGVTLFNRLLKDILELNLSDYLPERVLPVSTNPPKDLNAVIETEFAEIKKLLGPGQRKGLEAHSKLRALAIVEESLSGSRSQPSVSELRKIENEIKSGKKWQEIFPGVATLNLSTEGTGLTFTLRLTKNEGDKIQLVPEGTPGATVVAVKRVNELGYYTLNMKALSEKLNLTMPMCLCVVKELKLQEDEEYFKIFKLDSVVHKRYSNKALDLLRERIPTMDLREIWAKHKPSGKKKAVAA